MKVYRKSYGIFQGTGIQIDKKIQTDRAVEENRIQKAPISQEVYLVRN